MREAGEKKGRKGKGGAGLQETSFFSLCVLIKDKQVSELPCLYFWRSEAEEDSFKDRA